MPTSAESGTGASGKGAAGKDATSSVADAGLAALYQERILNHYRRPRHKGILERATGVHSVKNPLCGDDVTVAVLVRDGVVVEARYTGTGCSIMQATASMLMGLAHGRTREEIDGLARRFDAMLASGAADASLGELDALAGVAAFKARHKCARLPWQAMLGALAEGGR
ncbi:MAG: SUF system NifU family Fe-S cluster assembly protein [Gemmatimonadaceae bacterium]|nr:SUF system NifU family Fe-S cluster assembly protein [Gemmatimonadaceae bacterium]